MRVVRAAHLSRHATRSTRLGVLALAVGLVAGMGLQAPLLAAGSTPVATPAASAPVADLPTVLQVSSFNLLGYGHTAPGGDRKGWASGVTRMGWSVRLIEHNSLDVIGFQEMQRPQFDRFKELVGGDFGVYPGAQLTRAAMANSIAWRRAEWRLVEANTMLVPYFKGNLIRMPYVLLRNVQTGRQAYFYNSHNPADAHGPAQKWRDQAVQLEIGLVNRLRAESPDIPVFDTGDKNDREEFLCPMLADTEMQAANGGSMVNNVCSPPSQMKVDWVMGSSEVVFTDYQAIRSALVKKTTDHPLIVTTAVIPPLSVVTAPVSRVLVLSVEGLRPAAITTSGLTGTPAIHSMMATGASTLNARTAFERVARLPNLVGMMTGRRVDPTKGGHGVGWRTDPGTTVHAAAGRYVSSVFDLAHNFGMRTALLTSQSGLSRLEDSWDATNGGTDPYAPDNGRAKISRFILAADDRSMTTSARELLLGNAPTYTFAQFSGLNQAGRRYGWRSAEYAAALTETDRLIQRLLTTINSSSRLRGTTMVILTSEHGGSDRPGTPATLVDNYRVPLVITGPGVATGADLYTLNPQYTRPGHTRPTYAGAQPIRNTDIANLVTSSLGLPAIPGSTQNSDQSFTVLAPTAP
ncbi:alkaline phosphatase family protein [Nocardioides sp.]|uniref:alkaline phosphatase family protein n=1 Tax=Nocardioides sp. TaxID=35761 RepID=UPI003D10EDA6